MHPPDSLTRTRASSRPSEPGATNSQCPLVPVKTVSDSFGRYRIFADAASPVEFLAKEPNYDLHMDNSALDIPPLSYMDRLLHPFTSISDLLWTLHFFSSARNTLAHHHRGIELMQRDDFRPQDLTQMPKVGLLPLDGQSSDHSPDLLSN